MFTAVGRISFLAAWANEKDRAGYARLTDNEARKTLLLHIRRDLQPIAYLLCGIWGVLTKSQKTSLPCANHWRKSRRGSPTDASIFPDGWRWLRATGCLTGMGLLLALSAVPAGAQQQQQQPQRECFTVEMSHSAQGNPQGSILLDRCTGKTWLLLCIRNDTAGCAFKWAPIPDATEPAGAPG